MNNISNNFEMNNISDNIDETKSFAEVKKEIALLSLEERRKALRDVQCQPLPEDEIQETPQFLAEKLDHLEQTMDTIITCKHAHDVPNNYPNNTKMMTEAYELAQFVNPEYVNSDKFRLMFLRAERFDVIKTANRIFTYWNRKVDLVGTDKAFRPLSPLVFDFFGARYQHAMNLGGIRILPHFDDAGRAILFGYREYWIEDDDENKDNDVMLNVLWAVIHLAVNDPDNGEYIQRNGLVLLLARGDCPPGKADDTLAHKASALKIKWHDLLKALPIRVVSVHHITPRRIDNIQAAIHLVFFNVWYRARYRHYPGSPEQNVKALGKCGIPPDAIPQELGGRLQYDHAEWLSDQIGHEYEELGEFDYNADDGDDIDDYDGISVEFNDYDEDMED